MIWSDDVSAFAVFGNPIKHSKSGYIYKLFANEINIDDRYDLKLAFENNFDDMLYDFFDSGGLGANITVPFKERAFFLCNQLTERAMIARSVNTIKKQSDNTLLGDNTDGIGLMNDLRYLNWINQDNSINNNNATIYSIYCKNEPVLTRILLIGAGGAAKGIVPVLLEITGCYISVVNRNFVNAQKLVYYYHRIGRQNISYIDMNDLFCKSAEKKYSLIINASSSSMYNDIPKIPSFLITRTTRCYDLFYQNKDTLFIEWCKRHGANYCSDGLGMLVGQAAYSFYLWHDKFPSIDPVLNHLTLFKNNNTL